MERDPTLSDIMELSEEKLVAYIDGELNASETAAVTEVLSRNAGARERLQTLKNGGRPFAEAFDTLLDAAPDEKLQAMFAGLVAQKAGGMPSGDHRSSVEEENVVPFRSRAEQSQSNVQGASFWRMAVAAAVLALVFTGGLVTGGFFSEPQQVAEQKPGWREAAARYVAMFSKDTLEGMPTDPDERQNNLKKIETVLGLQLAENRISDQALSFQGTQLLTFEGKPLAQLSYLHAKNKPVALCIIPMTKEPTAPETETRHGLNIVHWVADGYGYMVIGDVPESELAQIAERFRVQFS